MGAGGFSSETCTQVISPWKQNPSGLLLLTGDGLQHRHLQAVIQAPASCHPAVVFLQIPMGVPSQRGGDRAGAAAVTLIALVFN